MSDPRIVPLSLGASYDAEVRIYPQAPGTDDASDMYVLDALGVTVLIRQRTDGSTYVHVDDDGMDAFKGPLVYEIRNNGENWTGQS